MNQHILTRYSVLINHQLISQEKLLEYLVTVDSMFKVLLGSDLSNYSDATMYNYLWQISDIIQQAKDLNEVLIDAIMEIISLKDFPTCSCVDTTIVH